MKSTPGIFGSLAQYPDETNATVKRLSASRRNQLRFFTAKHSNLKKWMALISHPVSTATQNDAITELVTPVIAFAGHLTSPVAGIDLSTANPTEVVHAAYKKWGVACFARLSGNFSVAILDPVLPGFVIARDAAGTQPIFYSCAKYCIFGSSAIEVLQASGMPAIANPRALYRYLNDGSVSGEKETLFDGVYELPAAHYLEAIIGCPPRILPLPANPNAEPCNVAVSFDQYSEELRWRLLETVKAQSLGRTTGVSLSGGIDSSSIMACLRSVTTPSEPLHAFCYVHGHSALPVEWNEYSWAKLMAAQAQATLHSVHLEASAIPSAISRVFEHQEFPFSSPVILAQAEVFRVAAENGMQAMLSGHGPDYLFGGGNSHIIVRAVHLLRRGRMSAAWSYLRGASQYAAVSPIRLLAAAIRQTIPMRTLQGRFSAGPAWACKSWFLRHGTMRSEKTNYLSTDLQSVILEQLHKSRLPSGLQWEGRNAQAYGLDNRLPFLVEPILSLAARLPIEYLVSNTGQTRHLLRHALRGLVPDSILDRPHPVGFAVPVLPWLHEQRPWVESHLRELESLPFYQNASTSVVWDRLQGNDASAWKTAYCTWRWITLLEWAKTYNVTFK